MVRPSTNPIVWATQTRIKHRDTFHAPTFYKWAHEWFKENGWRDPWDNEADHHETFYLDKTDLYGRKEMWIFWRFISDPEGIKNSYWRWHMDLNWHFIYMQDVQVMYQGKKMTMQKGEIELKIKTYIEFDYEGKWSKHPILKFFNQIFPKRIFKRSLFDENKRILYRESQKFSNQMKIYLKQKQFLPELDLETFHPDLSESA